MRKLLLPALAAVLTLACSNDLLSREPRLAGLWGGESMEFTATASKLVMHTQCEVEEFSGPVFLRPDGTFSANGTVNVGPLLLSGTILEARISGSIIGDTMRVVLEVLDRNGNWGRWGFYQRLNGVDVRGDTFLLTPGQHARYPAGAGCLG